MAKVKFIPNHHYSTCWKCKGQGCDICNKTGKFREDSYYLIYTNKKGQKMAFLVDTLK